MHEVAHDAPGFELVFDQPFGQGLFSPGYAIKANYHHFVHRGERYTSVGGGSVVIREDKGPPERFVVRETPLWVRGRRIKFSTLRVWDRQTGREMARRGLDDDAIEDSHGWVGDHAVKFVRNVLRSPQPPGRRWGVADYPEADAQVRLVPASVSAEFGRFTTPQGCGPEVRLSRRDGKATVRTDGFEFMPVNSADFAACDGNRLVVFSGTYSNRLRVDLLSLAGEPLGQGEVRLPLGLDTHWADLSGVTVRERRVAFTLRVNRKLRPSTTEAYGELLVDAALAPSASSRHQGARLSSWRPLADHAIRPP